MQPIRKFIAARSSLRCLATIVGLCLLTSYVTHLVTHDLPSVPALLENLPGSLYGAADDDKFSTRLRERFPIGSPEADLIRELWVEGFQPTSSLRAQHREALFDRVGDFLHDICHRSGYVYWSTDEAGHLTTISGNFFVDCP